MTQLASCAGLEAGTAMPSVAALAELRSLLDNLRLRSTTPLEKMPVEAPSDTPEEFEHADEPGALRDRTDDFTKGPAAGVGRGAS